jgi:hypothetical protein
MDYYELTKEKRDEIEERGVDYDLRACLEHNPQEKFDIYDIEQVLAVFAGENDEEDWRWIIKVNKECAKRNGARFVFLQGGCDYTGWDCQSWARHEFVKTAKQAAELAKDPKRNHRDETFLLGVYQKLIEQLKTNKSKTWREQKDEELGTGDIPKIR